jgi:WD40 repeat protein
MRQLLTGSKLPCVLEFLPNSRSLLGMVTTCLVRWDLDAAGADWNWVDDYRGLFFRFTVSRCGRYAAISEDRCLVVWDLGAWTPGKEPEAGNRQQSLDVIRTFDGREVFAMPPGKWLEAGDNQHILDVAFSPDGREVFTVLLEGGGVVRRRTGSWRKRPGFGGASRRLGGERGYFTGNLAISPDGRTLATNHCQGSEGPRVAIKLWDLPGGVYRRTVSWHHDIDQLAFSPDGRWLMARGEYRLGLYDATTLALRCEYTASPEDRITRVVFHPSGRFLGVSGGPLVRFLTVDGLRPLRTFDWGLTNTYGMALSADGMLAGVSGEGGRVVVWDVDESS